MTQLGNREIHSPIEPHRARVHAKRNEYGRSFRALIDPGPAAGSFQVDSVELVPYPILDLGTGYRDDGEFALRLVGSRPSRGPDQEA